MKIFVLASAAIVALSTVEAHDMANLHLRIHTKGDACTIESESQCDGQNWHMSTCCKDSNYECRWDDKGQNVKRCQKKHGDGDKGDGDKGDGDKGDGDKGDGDKGDGDMGDGDKGDGDKGDGDKGGDYYASYVADWADCTKEDVGCETDTSKCVYHSQYYAQCKTGELPSGELCGQSDGTNEWMYDHCPSGESCKQNGSDYRCTKEYHHHHTKHHHGKNHDEASCTIESESQCDGQNWHMSTCCKDSNYECRWDDKGQNVKRCQKKHWW